MILIWRSRTGAKLTHAIIEIRQFKMPTTLSVQTAKYIVRLYFCLNCSYAGTLITKMSALDKLEDLVREKIVVEKYTHRQLSNELQLSFPGEKGFSVRSVERFCSEKGIKKITDISEEELEMILSEAVLQVIGCLCVAV